MQTSGQLKSIVKAKYGEIANRSSTDCSCGCSNRDDFAFFNDDYKKQPGYHAGADLGLGCGIPKVRLND